MTIKRDATPPTLSPSVSQNKVLLNGTATAIANATDAISGVASQSCNQVDASSVGSKSVTCTATNQAGLSASANASYSVVHVAAGLCLCSPGHAIIEPINADGTSVFKQGSTVPTKFRVCDANGRSIGTAGVVSSFSLTKTISGSGAIDEAVDSTAPDPAFWWSTADQQWIFNMSTKSIKARYTYYYRITLNDGSAIDFNFGPR